MTKAHRRVPLSRERIVQAAIDVADREGLQALTMRRLGAELGVEAMAVYKHVSGKDDILDGMVELVVSLIETPGDGLDWRDAMRRRAMSAREVPSGRGSAGIPRAPRRPGLRRRRAAPPAR